MNYTAMVPGMGLYEIYKISERDDLSFKEKAEFAAATGVMSTPGVIVLAETMGFSHGLVKATQITAASAPLAMPAAVATATIVAGVKLNESTRERIGSKFFTTPFTSGFGPVV